MGQRQACRSPIRWEKLVGVLIPYLFSAISVTSAFSVFSALKKQLKRYDCRGIVAFAYCWLLVCNPSICLMTLVVKNWTLFPITFGYSFGSISPVVHRPSSIVHRPYASRITLPPATSIASSSQVKPSQLPSVTWKAASSPSPAHRRPKVTKACASHKAEG